ncbi:CAHM6 protein, partial [Sylvia atricapilla]|nr:CAHM6 protein [Sylvia atricapilla]
MDSLQKILDFCLRHQTILGCSIISLLTAASEYIFSSVVFKCPCNSNNMLYGSSFLLAPAFVLFLFGFMVNPSTWHLFTGKCSAEKHREYSPWGTSACCCQVLVPMIAKASVAPLTWIAVALLGANFYECAASGSSLIAYFYCKDNGTDCRNQLLKVPCDEELSANLTSERLSLHAQSQLAGWFLIAIIMTGVVISTCVSRCYSPVSYLQLRLYEIYSKIEEEQFEIKSKEHAEELAKININSFFEADDPAPFHTPSTEEWHNISTLYTINSEAPYYSLLHQFVDSKKGKSSKRGKSTKFKEQAQDHTDYANMNEAQT